MKELIEVDKATWEALVELLNATELARFSYTTQESVNQKSEAARKALQAS